MEISQDTYFSDRLENQIEWYDTKSSQCQKFYKRLKRTEVVLATAIPLFSGLASQVDWLPILVGCLGAAIAIIEGTLSMGKYHENWIEYRSICETLRHEKYMFLARVGVYNAEGPFTLFVERVESIISKENVNWANLNSSTKKGDNKE